MKAVLRINSKDNVVTCLRSVYKGETITVDSMSITVNMDVPIFHKIALEDISTGGHCYKYGEIIGDAIEDIKTGDHVHVHNIESTRGRGDKKRE